MRKMWKMKQGGLLALIRLKIMLQMNYFYVAIVITLKGGYNVIHHSNKICFFLYNRLEL